MVIDEPLVNHDFMKELDQIQCFDRRSFVKWERITHSRGDSLLEIFTLRAGRFKRYADLVVYPSTHNHCEVSIGFELNWYKLLSHYNYNESSSFVFLNLCIN